MRESNSSKTIAWIALTIATLAFTLAWVAYNRTADQALEETIKEKVQEAVAQVETRLRREESESKEEEVE
jgi:hypothetical protein